MSRKGRDILYLTYDGITEPLGQSQILSYVKGLARIHGWKIDILSFEKNISTPLKTQFKSELERLNIRWIAKRFTTSPPVVSTLYDMLKMYITGINLFKTNEYKIIHARSLMPAYVGLKLKEKFGAKLIFDMRGFWADQRIESGVWNGNNPAYRYLYKITKRIERELLSYSDHIVVLTHKAKQIIEQWQEDNYISGNSAISVIPCCAVPDDIPLSTPENKKNFRKRFNLPEHAYIIGHIGSFIPWYLFEEMIVFFKELKRKRSDAHLLIAIKNINDNAIKFFKDRLDESDYTLTSVSAQESKLLIATLDAGLVFVQQTFSSAGASPTKLAELLFAGVPVIATDIGDIRYILNATGGGIVISDFSREALSQAIDLLLSQNWNPQQIRERAIPLLNTKKGIDVYNAIYKDLLKMDGFT